MPYKLLTPRKRRISLSGSFSGTRGIEVDLTKVWALVLGSSFVGWGINGRSNYVGSTTVRLNRTLTEFNATSGSTDFARGMRPTIGFLPYAAGPLNGVGPTTRDAVLVAYDAVGVETGRWVVPHNGVDADDPAYYSGLDFGGGLFGVPGSTRIDRSDSGAWSFYADVEEYFAPYRYEPAPLPSRDESEIPPRPDTVANVWNGIAFKECYDPTGRRGFIIKGVDYTVVNPSRVGVQDDLYYPVLEMTASGREATSASLSATYDGDGFTLSPVPMSGSGVWGSGTESTIANNAGYRTASSSFFPVPRTLVAEAKRWNLDTMPTDSSTVQWGSGFGSFGMTPLYTNTGANPITRAFSWQHARGLVAGQLIASPFTSYVGATHETGPRTIGNLIPANLSAQLTDASAGTLGARLRVFGLRGRSWDSLRLWQEPYWYITRSPFQPVNPITGGGWTRNSVTPISHVASLTNSGGVLRMVMAGSGAGSATQRGITLNGYGGEYETRFLTIRIRSTVGSNKAFRLKVNTSTSGGGLSNPDVLSGTTGAAGTWVERTLDRYDSITTFIVPGVTLSLPPPRWTTVELDSLEYGETYEVEWIRGGPLQSSKLTVYGTDLTGVTDTLPTLRTQLFPYGKIQDFLAPAPSLTGENPSSWQAEDLAPAGPLTDIFDPVSPNTFISAAANYWTSFNYAYHLNASGRDLSGMVLDADASGAGVTLHATEVYLFYDSYPGAGDVFNQAGGGYAIATNLYYGLTLRSEFYGGILGGGGGEVVVTETDPTTMADVGERGRGGAASDEFFRTGPVYARTAPTASDVKNSRVWMDPDYPTAFRFKTGDRTRYWSLWRSEGQGLTADISHANRPLRGLLTGGHLHVGTPNDLLASTWSDADTGLTLKQPCLRFDPASGRLWLYYNDGGVIKRRYSDDEGGTWSVATTVFAAGVQPTFVPSKAGVHYAFCRTSGGGIEGAILDGFGNFLSTGIVVVAASVADYPLAAWINEAAGRIFVMYRATGGTIVTVSSTDGLTYS